MSLSRRHKDCLILTRDDILILGDMCGLYYPYHKNDKDRLGRFSANSYYIIESDVHIEEYENYSRKQENRNTDGHRDGESAGTDCRRRSR